MKTTIQKIYAALQADVALAAVIKSWSLGGINKNQLIFPFCNIGPPDMSIETYTIGNHGSDEEVYNIRIQFGTRSLMPEVAYYGDSASNVKGILEICDLAKAVCRGNLFDGAFTRPASVTRIITDMNHTSGEFIWVAEITVNGRRKVTRTRP